MRAWGLARLPDRLTIYPLQFDAVSTISDDFTVPLKGVDKAVLEKVDSCPCAVDGCIGPSAALLFPLGPSLTHACHACASQCRWWSSSGSTTTTP